MGIFVFIGCQFEPTKPITPLTMHWAHQGSDTISVFAVLSIAFSMPITASQVELSLTPANDSWYSALNNRHDTLRLIASSPLAGNTRFVVRLAQEIESTEGASLFAGTDSIVFFTRALEQEPNNSPATADILTATLFGTMATTSDTDYIAIMDTMIDEVRLVSLLSKVGYVMLDSELVELDRSSGEIDSTLVLLPNYNRRPVYLLIYSPLRVMGCRYGLDAIKF